MIARRRKRPRSRSASFRTLWWLIRAEAVWWSMCGPGFYLIRNAASVRFVRLPGSVMWWHGRYKLEEFPERRVKP